jgi:hypothetical protein
MHVLAHGSRDADATGRTFSLEPCGYVHHITVDIGSIWNYIADVNADTEPDRPIWRLIAITDGHLLLDFHRTSHGSVNAIEHNKKAVASCIDNPAAVLRDGRVDENAPKLSETLEGSDIIQPYQAAVANHVGMDDGCQLSPISWLTLRVRFRRFRHSNPPRVESAQRATVYRVFICSAA